MADGRLNKCKVCARRDVRENREARTEHYRAYERMRAQRPERRDAQRESVRRGNERDPGRQGRYVRASRARHPERYRSRAKINNALRDGRLTRQPCEVCGKRAQAHHEDYSRPLDVRWLCKKHHDAVHERMTA